MVIVLQHAVGVEVQAGFPIPILRDVCPVVHARGSLAGSWIVVIMAVATFFIAVGESTAAIIENPFGTDPNALDLTRICQVIETSVSEILGSRATTS